MSDNRTHVQDGGMRLPNPLAGNTVRKGGVNQVSNTTRPVITPRPQTIPPTNNTRKG